MVLDPRCLRGQQCWNPMKLMLSRQRDGLPLAEQAVIGALVGREEGKLGEDVLMMNLPARRGEISQSADGAKGEQLWEVNGTLGEERNPKTAGCYPGRWLWVIRFQTTTHQPATAGGGVMTSALQGLLRGQRTQASEDEAPRDSVLVHQVWWDLPFSLSWVTGIPQDRRGSRGLTIEKEGSSVFLLSRATFSMPSLKVFNAFSLLFIFWFTFS